ncbi:heme/hemin ABC transporter substrate-binding protein [Viridibacterium curvum]|uniref:Hemin ABC transporter substrate-binding protein n=1 Tax=Viridibacterium curvum TaxID=1101404 RepID=A0ABP9QMG4_9RHOO
MRSLTTPSRRRTLRQLALLATAGALPGLHAAPATGRQRLVSVGGGLTEIVYLLDASADLVGVDTTSLFPAVAQNLPSVGYARTLSAEGILALSPTHLLASEEAGPPTVLQQVRAAGITVSVLAANHRFEGLLDRIKRIGEIIGRAPQAAQHTQRLQREWSSTTATIAARKRTAPKVLFVLAHAPNQIMVSGSNTGADAMITYAGGKNAITGFEGYKPLTPEAAIAAQPDLILLTDQGLTASGGIDSVLRLPGLVSTPAGQARRVIAQDAVFMLGFGPRLPAAVRALDAAFNKALSA